MTMNYLDYTDDSGMYMLTKGQKARISALFLTGGARATLGVPFFKFLNAKLPSC